MKRFEKQLNMEEIKRWFDPDKWDMGYLTKEQLKICSYSPIKSPTQTHGWDFTNARLSLHFNWMGICNGIVLNINKQVLVVNQNHDSWSLPKGHVDPGETAFEAAKREPTGKPNMHENKSEKNEIFKDNKIISSKSKFNEKIRFKEFLNISVNSTTYIIYFFIYYKVYVSKI